jgi:hypothetical protein
MINHCNKIHKLIFFNLYVMCTCVFYSTAAFNPQLIFLELQITSTGLQ